mgnify:CR=1 FL=1
MNDFEFFAYSLMGNQEDELQKRLINSFDVFKDVSELSDKEVAILCRQDNIDIAIDLNGYTQNSRSSIFAYRAAPIQINYLGFAGTSIITDGLILHLDAGNTDSYSGSGNTWSDISGNNNHGTLNGPTFVNSGLKHFVFNGSDDVTTLNLSSYSNLTFEFWFYDNRTSGQRDLLTYNGDSGSFTFNIMNHF